jgi:hypothetical protein
MSAWTHSHCERCWADLYPGRVPTRVRGDGEQTCCRCGRAHTSGIYVRAAPETLLCHGEHPRDEDG